MLILESFITNLKFPNFLPNVIQLFWYVTSKSIKDCYFQFNILIKFIKDPGFARPDNLIILLNLGLFASLGWNFRLIRHTYFKVYHSFLLLFFQTFGFILQYLIFFICNFIPVSLFLALILIRNSIFTTFLEFKFRPRVFFY